jgi:putative flavoprotein involved in K+ transport
VAHRLFSPMPYESRSGQAVSADKPNESLITTTTWTAPLSLRKTLPVDIVPVKGVTKMSTRRIETVIVGAGRAGLAVSYYLKRLNRRHIVLEQAAQAGSAWRHHRWDSFTLNTPNWQSASHEQKFLPKTRMRFCRKRRSSPTSRTTSSAFSCP